MKIFVSYTSSDKDWAQWIGWNLRQTGHEPFLHDWEIGAGENIAGWMEDRFHQADKLIGVFSDAYCQAAFSQSERWSAYWRDPRGRSGFFVPIEVRKVSKWPGFVTSLKRLSLVGIREDDASQELVAFFRPPQFPTEKPAFPSSAIDEVPQLAWFTEGGEPIGNAPPAFPAPPSIGIDPRTAIDPATSIRCIDDHEPKPVIFGRDEEIETITTALLERKIAIVAGGPGMGKTALATAAMYDPRAVAHFRRRRVFVSLETATGAHAILAKFVEALGLLPVGDEISLIRILETNAAELPIAAVIDNAETVFDVDRTGSERLFNLVGNIKGLSVVITIRGIAPPLWGSIQIEDLPKLPAGPASAAFLAIAGAAFKNDPNLSHLLEALDGHALSIRLVAAQAIGLPSLKGLRESWDDAHAEILRISGEDESRLTSVRASLALSLNNRRMKSTPLARRLIAVLAFLPGGLAEVDVRTILGERGALTKAKANEAVTCLHQLRLVERRPDLRLRMLNPLRECVRSDVQPLEIDRTRLVQHYLECAARADMVGTRHWQEYREQTEREADNLDSVCELAVQTNIANRHLEGALKGLARFHIFSGKAAVGSLDRAAARLQSKAPSHLAGVCAYYLSQIARSRFDHETAKMRAEEAQAQFHQIGDSPGEANCIYELGRIANQYYLGEAARLRFEEALHLYQRGGDAMGEANCAQGLAEIAKGRSDHVTACALLEKALTLHRSYGGMLGEANCIFYLGQIADQRLDLEIARAHTNQALTLYRRMGANWGEINCLELFGDISRQGLDYDAALTYLNEGLIIARRAGSAKSEAAINKKFGIIANARGDYKLACARLEEALALNQRTGNAMSEVEILIWLGRVRQKAGDKEQGLADIEKGFADYFRIEDSQNRSLAGSKAIYLAFISTDPREAQRHREFARTAWKAIGRLDLVRDWVDQD